MRVIARLLAQLPLYFWTESNLTKDPLPRTLYKDVDGDEHFALGEGSCQVEVFTSRWSEFFRAPSRSVRC
jgi:hypothetical protein